MKSSTGRAEVHGTQVMKDFPIDSPTSSPLPTADISFPSVPRLLVSVRSVAEACAALAGGVDIVDVKEPSHGSLGMASTKVIADIAQFVTEQSGLNTRESSSIPLSVALGEIIDWRNKNGIDALPDAVTFAKLGPSGLKDHADWRDEWFALRCRFDRERSVPLKWVAVAYADAEEARSPTIDSIFQAAAETQCAGLLIDTYSKTSGTLLNHCTESELKSLATRCHSAGLFLALAGKITRDSLPLLKAIAPNVIAIRSAACEHTDRTLSISVKAIASFRDALYEFFVSKESLSRSNGA